jgi:hypothetical protein
MQQDPSVANHPARGRCLALSHHCVHQSHHLLSAFLQDAGRRQDQQGWCAARKRSWLPHSPAGGRRRDPGFCGHIHSVYQLFLLAVALAEICRVSLLCRRFDMDLFIRIYCRRRKSFLHNLPGGSPGIGGQKREVGASPTQTRYCNWRAAYLFVIYATVLSGWEGLIGRV